MAEVKITRSRYIHAAMVVNNDLLRRLVDTIAAENWKVSSFEVETTDDRTLRVETLEEFVSFSSSIWQKAEELSVNGELDEQRFRNDCNVSVTFHKHPWWHPGEPFHVYIWGEKEGQILTLDARLRDFIASNSQWYSFMSRGLWWWVGFLIVGNSWLLTKSLSILLRTPLIDLGWWPLFPELLFGAMLWGGRQYFFPATVFAIGENDKNYDQLVRIQGRLGKVAGFIVATIVAALIYKWIK